MKISSKEIVRLYVDCLPYVFCETTRQDESLALYASYNSDGSERFDDLTKEFK